MKYAFFPGCVSKGACPELYQSVMQVYPQLGIDLEEMTTASCTGAGVLQEKDEKLGDVLNARTFALAEQQGPAHYDHLQYMPRGHEPSQSSAHHPTKLPSGNQRDLTGGRA